MADFQSVTHVDIPKADVQVSKTASGYTAVLTANGQTWTGDGERVGLAIEAVLEAVRSVDLNHGLGRPRDRVRVAASIG